MRDERTETTRYKKHLILVLVLFVTIICDVKSYQYPLHPIFNKGMSTFTFKSSSHLLSSKNENDPFEDFDPRNSPHSYSSNKPDFESSRSSLDISKPLPEISSKSPAPDTKDNDSYENIQKPSTNNQNKMNVEDTPDFFDPRISPHQYPNGIDSSSQVEQKTSSSSSRKIGLILIDHGSRKDESNETLKKIASVYQNSPKCPSNLIVRSAHMEIASPSIEDVMREFMLSSSNVKKIICHPYFLSPGRHVTEDIPFLINDAKKKILGDGDVDGLDDVEVVLTDHTGSNINIMVDVIGEIVDRSVFNDGNKDNKDDDELGGFFGNVKKMMENVASE